MEEILLDIGVGPRHIGLGLVVVVIGDEILHRVVGEEAPELAIELRRQRLVRGEDQRRALGRLDHLGHGVGLAGAGDAEQHLGAVVALDAFDQFGDRGRLVALRLVVGPDLETDAAFGFFRPRRPVRRPDPDLAVFALEFGTAVADQRFQRIGGGGDAKRLHPVARRPRQRGGVFLLGGEAELFGEFRIQRRDGGGGAVIGWSKFGLRRFTEPVLVDSLPPCGGGLGEGGNSRRCLCGAPHPDPSPRGREERRAPQRHRVSPHRRACSWSRPGRDAPRLRRRRGGPRNYPAAAAIRWTSRCRFRRG